MKASYSLALSILSGVLLWLSWPVSPCTFVIFFAFVPLLLAAGSTHRKLTFFLYSFLALLIWNAGTTWWIWNSTDVGAIGAIIANSLLMTLPWYGYRVFYRRYGQRTGLAALVVFWMSFEYIHLNWQLSWPWLTLGNVFAMHPDWVQWYEFTGTSGGTLWVLLTNIFFFLIVKEAVVKRFDRRVIAGAALTWLLPFGISWIVLTGIDQRDTTTDIHRNVIIVQPNIDPYSEKFDASSLSHQIQVLLSLSEQQLDTNTALIIWPETALTASVSEDEVQSAAVYRPIFDFINKHPGITLLTGIETYKLYGREKLTKTARYIESQGIYYDALNAALSIKKGEPLQFYTKSKLVPGVETLPDFLQWMGPVFEQFGGTAGGYAHSDTSSVFTGPQEPYITAPIICYESIYGEYVSTYVKKGANLLTIITNDGWWKNTPGHKQHLQYARLRAIETRRYVARSANTGISAVIDDKGNLLDTRPWDEAAFIKADIPILTRETFYVQWGDLLSKAALPAAIGFVIINIVLLMKKRKQMKTAPVENAKSNNPYKR